MAISKSRMLFFFSPPVSGTVLGTLDTTVNILENIFCFFGVYILVGVDIIKILTKLYCMAEGEKYYGKIGKIEQGSQSEILGAERGLQFTI